MVCTSAKEGIVCLCTPMCTPVWISALIFKVSPLKDLLEGVGSHQGMKQAWRKSRPQSARAQRGPPDPDGGSPSSHDAEAVGDCGDVPAEPRGRGPSTLWKEPTEPPGLSQYKTERSAPDNENHRCTDS